LTGFIFPWPNLNLINNLGEVPAFTAAHKASPAQRGTSNNFRLNQTRCCAHGTALPDYRRAAAVLPVASYPTLTVPQAI
jgi:hypothetical protein